MSSIRLATASNVRALQSLSNALVTSEGKWADSIDHEGLEDEIGRFRVWSGNLGALQKGHSSLDYRLRDSPLLSTNALKFLKELEDNLIEAVSVATEARLPYELQQKPESATEEEDDDDGFFDDDDEDDEDGGSRTELSMRFAEIVDIIDNLYKLSVRIRTPTIRSRSLKAATYKPKDPDTGVDLLSTYAGYDVQHIQELLSHLRRPYQESTENGEYDYLITRLSAAVTLRRRQFKYWKRHRDKLGISTVPEDLLSQPIPDRPSAPQRNDTLEARPGTPIIVTTKDAPSQRTGKTMLSGTEATQHHQSLDEIIDSKSVTSYAVTVKDLHGRGVQLPPPPRAADGEKDFECPYCYIICPARYGRGRAWRTHLLQDLQPYVCTYPDCDSAEQLFRSRREWAEHEASHRKAWRCPEHPSAVFKSSNGLEDHFRREHSDNFSDAQLPSIVKVGETTTVDVRSICPICFAPADHDGLGDFHNHIANHLERVATFALPNGTEDEIDGASSAASRGRSDSGSSRNISDLSLPSDDQNPTVTLQADDASSVSTASIDYPIQERSDQNKEAVLNLYDIPTLRSLYRSRRLLQRDQSFAPNDSYNQLVSFCHRNVTKLKVDAIVNSANKRIKLTSGTTLNNTILRAAGPALAEEARAKDKPSANQAILTRGYNLPSTHVIHVSRPGYSMYRNYKSTQGTKQFNQLIDCYRSAFKVATEYGIKTIAFPCIGTGGVGFPPRVAARIALQEVREYLDAHPEHGFERIVFCVNTIIDEQAYVDFFPVYFPPTHGDLDIARSSVWTEDRAALALQVLDTRGVVQQVFAGLNTGLGSSVPHFPKSILTDLSGIDSSLSSIRRYLVWSQELKTSLRDLRLACSVMQLFCGSVTEIVELAKDHASLGQRSDKSIWDDFVSDMHRRHGAYPHNFLKACRDFFVWLDQIITVEYIELDDIADIRQSLERYKVKVRSGHDGAGTQDHLNEVLYTREFQRETVAHTRDTVRLHQIQSVQQLYKLGELEEKPTLAHPSAIFNNAVCLAREDITRLEVDMMVSSTDMTFAGMGTLDRKVFLKGGFELREAVAAFGRCKEGDVKVTEGYLLPAKHVLHVIPPEQLRKDTKNVLRNIYREIINTAVAMRATSIAIPSLGTGMLNYPRRDSASMAIEEVKRFLETADPNSLIGKIIFVVYSSSDEFIYKSLLPVYFPPIDLSSNRALSASVQQAASSAASDSKETPKRTLFGSIGEAVRSVRFGKTPEPSRSISSYEEHALIGFESHAKNCETCKDIRTLYVEGRDLCDKGYPLAQIVLWHMNMQLDHYVYRKPDSNGISFRLDFPTELFPLSASLLEIVEKSYRDANRSQPFVSPNRPQGTVSVSQVAGDVVPPGVIVHNTEVEVPLTSDLESTRAHVLEWSEQENEWKLMNLDEIHIRVHPNRVEVWDETQGILLWNFPFNAEISVKRHKTTPEVVVSKIGDLSRGVQSDILFRCRSDAECRLLRSRLQDAIGRFKPQLTLAVPEESLVEQGQPKRDALGDDLTPTQRWNNIRNELATMKRASGGLSDLQQKMERLSTATSTLNPDPRQRKAASDRYDASRSPLGTRILLCLTADLKSRPGSYIGLHTDKIVSAVRATPEEVQAALKELVHDREIHNTIDDNTWVASHEPEYLPVLLDDFLTQKSREVDQSNVSSGRPRHAQVADEAEHEGSGIPVRGSAEQYPLLLESEQYPPPQHFAPSEGIVEKVHAHLVAKSGTMLNGALHVDDIAVEIGASPSEVRQALETLERQGKAHVPAIDLDNWWIATAAKEAEQSVQADPDSTQDNADDDIFDPSLFSTELGKDKRERNERQAEAHWVGTDKKMMLSMALQKETTAVQLDNAQDFEGAVKAYENACELLQQVILHITQVEEKSKLAAIVSYRRRMDYDREAEALETPTTVVRDPPSFKDTPPSPTLDVLSEAFALNLDTMNIDNFFSYSKPFGARWTRIDKRLVDSRVLLKAEEEFDETGDSLVVHRVLRREEIQRWAEQSVRIRQHLSETKEAREHRARSRTRDDREKENKGKGKERERRDQEQERLDRVLAGDMKEGELRHFGDLDDERYL
ncbi:hypothetical protein EK21DRAFT_69924 [Setomelanomma holmii]|uniref:Macro domain-containing protein n=1 Tax=Setomelanomma holmii TaxID=210430 RepID=A0A9P4H7K7_9PLEO|nr:hypothetical protein EK21DRAFT_69924 [Setomelanomma holmii]